MTYIKKILISLNLLVFGVGSFLCFIVSVVQGNDRLLIGGVFLLLLTFVNQKIIYTVFATND